MYLYVISIFVIILLAVLRTLNSYSILRMSLWIYISYVFLLLTHLFSGISYNVGSVFRILPYLILCLFLLILGEKIGLRVKSASPKSLIKVKLNRLCLFSVFGAALMIFDLLRLNEVNFGMRIVDLKISLFGVLGNAMESLGIIAWLVSLYEYRMNKVKIPLVAYLALIAYVSGGILSAGRQSILLISIASVILLIWSKKRKNELTKPSPITAFKKSQPWRLYIVLILFFSYFIVISNVRSGISNLEFKNKTLEKSFNAKTSSITKNEYNKLGVFSDIYIEYLYYYSHELIRLDVFYQHYHYHPLFGLGQLGYVERRLQWLFGKQSDLSWNEQVKAIERIGKFSSHTWGTFITNFIVDFGRIGTLLMCLLVGVIVGVLTKAFDREVSSFSVVRLCIVCAGAVFSIQFSPFSELIWTIPVILSSFLKVVPKGTT